MSNYHKKHFNKERYLQTSNYFTDLPIHYEANVLDVKYIIDDNGKISLRVVTDVDSYLKAIGNMTGRGSLIDNVFNVPTIKVGDVFRIILQENSNFDKLYWVWMKVDTENNDKPMFYTTTKHIHNCPVCNEPLTAIDDDKYCLNNHCPAKIKLSIRRFLQKATFETWEMEDLITFDKLITIGRIKDISDIYNLTAEEINSLEPYYTETEINRGTYLINKINKTRGTVTLFNFLNSLCVPKIKGYLLKEYEINKLQSIDNFLEILSDFDTERYGIYMSKKAAHVLRNYFNRDSTISYITKLIDENVFDS